MMTVGELQGIINKMDSSTPVKIITGDPDFASDNIATKYGLELSKYFISSDGSLILITGGVYANQNN